MGLASTIRLFLLGDSRGAVRAIEGVEKSGKKATGTLDKLGHRMDETGRSAHRMGGAIGSITGVVGIGGLAFGIKDVVEAGMHWQTQQAQLRDSLRSTGLVGRDLAEKIKGIGEQVDRTSTHGGFAPTVETAGISKLVTETHSATKALKLNTEVVAVARRAGLDYASAYSLVARAQTGQARGLAKYIGVVQPVTSHVQALTLAHQQEVAQLGHLSAAQKAANPGLVAQLVAAKRLNPEMLRHAQLLDKQATAAMVNERIMRQLGGATAAYSKTAQGAVSNAANGFDAMKEQLGRSFLPMVTKVGMAMAGLARWMERHKHLVMVLIVATTSFAVALGTLKLAIVTVETATKAWVGVQAVLDAELWANPIGLIILAIAALTAEVIYCYVHFQGFRNVVNSVFSWLVGAAKDTVGFFAKHWRTLAAVIAGPFAPIVLMITHLKQVKKLAKDIISLPGKAYHAVTGAVGSIQHFAAHPFGFHAGGLVPGFAGGGLVGGNGNTDRVPAMLKPNEFVLRDEVVHSVGVANLNALNASGRMASGGQPDVIELHHTSMIGPRILAEEVVRYQLRQNARA